MKNVSRETSGSLVWETISSANSCTGRLSTHTTQATFQTILFHQLSKEWILGVDETGIESAFSRSGLSPKQIEELLTARDAGKVRTQLVVMKPKHLGTGVTKGMANHKQLGPDSGLPLNDIVIIEMGN